jgi:hypothetical protein
MIVACKSINRIQRHPRDVREAGDVLAGIVTAVCAGVSITLMISKFIRFQKDLLLEQAEGYVKALEKSTCRKLNWREVFEHQCADPARVDICRNHDQCLLDRRDGRFAWGDRGAVPVSRALCS